MQGTLRLVVVLAAICFGAGLALSGVYEVTKEPIAYQLKLEVIRSLEAVLPGLTVDPDKDFVELTREEGTPVKVYRSADGGVVNGVAFQVVAPDGYSGNIFIMMGVMPDGILGGIEILSHAETPGLGTGITEEEWKGQLRGKSLDNADLRVKKDGGEIDQITGATISPRAVVGAVKSGLEWFEANRETILAEEGS